jgi:hypothetical protein
MKDQRECDINTNRNKSMNYSKIQAKIGYYEIKPEQVGKQKHKEYGHIVQNEHHPLGYGVILVQPPDA